MSVVLFSFFFSSRRRHTRFKCDWSSDVCSSDLHGPQADMLMGINGYGGPGEASPHRSEEHTSELQSHLNLVCRPLLEKKTKTRSSYFTTSASTTAAVRTTMAGTR